jgi:hypothetical protein
LPSTPLREFAWYGYSAWNSVLTLVGSIPIVAAAPGRSPPGARVHSPEPAVSSLYQAGRSLL